MIFVHCTASPLSCGYVAVMQITKAAGHGQLRSCGADGDDNGVCDIIYPINLKEDEQKGLDGNGGVFSYITDIRRWIRIACADNT